MTLPPPVVVMRYHEVALKGRNRPHFVNQLHERVRRALTGLPVGPLQRASARVLAPVTDAAAWPAVRERLARIFGIANFAPAIEVPLCADDRPPDAIVAPLAEVALALLAGRTIPSFRIASKRSDKTFPIQSPDVNALVGARVKAATGARVDLDHADVTVTIDLVRDRGYVSVERLEGAGGLPVGTSGRVLALLSGGIDSPVAAWRMMRRGCRVDFVHFHSAPFVDRTSQQKALALAERLVGWEGEATLWQVPFFEVQRQVIATAPKGLRVVLYRRMMLRIAEELAHRSGAEALVTGESLGQVASQTLANIAVVEAATTLLVLRPLIGMDKGEIMDQAERIGTFETSIIEDQDCCSLFAPRHPATRARPEEVADAEARVDVAGLVRLTVDAAERVSLRFPPAPARAGAASASEGPSVG